MNCRALKKKVWLGHDNGIVLRLDYQAPSSDRQPAELGDVTRMTLDVAGETLIVNHSESPAYINWWDAALNAGEVRLTLGVWASLIPIAPGNYAGRLIVTNPANPNGVVWVDGDGLLLEFV